MKRQRIKKGGWCGLNKPVDWVW